VRLFKLPKVLPGIHAPLAEVYDDVEIAGITHDSRRVKRGWVFVAIPGHQRNGADFIEDAVARGAAAIVAEHKVCVPQPVPVFVVQNARRALATLANSFFLRPSRRLQVIGVTGTNGKTTTTYMIRAIFGAAGHRCGILGTIAYETGRRTLPASITTPESVDIQEFMAEMLAEGMEYAAIEVSSHAMCMRRVDFVQFAVGVFTNLTSEHLDYHGTLSNYREAKARFFRLLGPATYAVLNADDRNSAAMARATCATVLRYGTRGEVDVKGRVRNASLDGTDMILSCTEGQVDLRLPLIGRHNVSNALAAATTALALGCDLGVVRTGLENMPPVPGRLERVQCEKGCRVLVDYAHTDQALKSVLDSLRKLSQKQRIIVVFGAGGDRDRAKRPRMGRVVSQRADMAWVTSDNPRTEEPNDIIRDILSGVSNRRNIRVQPDRNAAIAEALSAAGPGDLILIAGKGHERTQRFRDTIIPFDDREAVRRAVGGPPEEALLTGA